MKLSSLHGPALVAAIVLSMGCSQTGAVEPAETAEAEAGQSILASSTPAAGSTVSGPVNELMLHFSPPARLAEVTVTGPDGMMPMMLTPVGEVEHYSLPLSGLGAGTYTVDWRANAAGQEHRGRFSFTVR